MQNLTPYAATYMPAMNLQDEDIALVVVAGSFDVPTPGADEVAPLRVSERQPPVPLGDTYHGEPGASSLRWEGQAVCARPGTDIYVDGYAWAPRGRPAARVEVSVQVGELRRYASVFGDRSWGTGMRAGIASAPIPFERLPLIYERCFGGFLPGVTGETGAAAERNPVGRGLYADTSSARGEPLPNIEDPEHLIVDPRDRPRVQGFGPVARGWLPRRSFAGSYTRAWVESRAPLWPADLDPRFFIAAAPGLYASPYLRGGEEVVIVGMHPDGALRFRLPRRRLRVKFVVNGRETRCTPVLDAVMLEPDNLRVTLIWRASIVTTPDILAVEDVLLRELAHWEGADL
jgi:hypothetical protein